MKLIKTNFKDLIIIKHNVYEDERGYFKEKFKKEMLEKITDSKLEFCQENSVKSKLNVLRGLHFQKDQYAQSKLISVESGKILDVVIDLRRSSKTFGKSFKIVLSKENALGLFIPKGFAHAYLSLEKENIIYYQLDNYYNPKFESGIIYNVPIVKIKWPKGKFIVSKKDKKLLTFKKFQLKFKSL